MPAAKKNKKKSLLSRVNWQSPKTRGVLILAIFALVGGGALVYRTFAATNSVVYSYANKNITAEGPVNIQPDPNAKGGPQIYAIKNGGGVYTSKAAPIRGGKVCVQVRADANTPIGANIIFGGQAINTYSVVDNQKLALSSVWKEHCRTVKATPPSGLFYFVENRSDQKVYVSTITHTYENPTSTTDGKNPAPTNPTPVVEPTCGKNCSK